MFIILIFVGIRGFRFLNSIRGLSFFEEKTQTSNFVFLKKNENLEKLFELEF